MNHRTIKLVQDKQTLTFNFDGTTFQELQQSLRKVMSFPPEKSFSLTYKDEEGDSITVGSEGDLHEAFRTFEGRGELVLSVTQPRTNVLVSPVYQKEGRKEVEVEKTPSTLVKDMAELMVTEPLEVESPPSNQQQQQQQQNSNTTPVESKAGKACEHEGGESRWKKKAMKYRKKEQRAERKQWKLTLHKQNWKEKKGWRKQKERLLKNSALLSEPQKKEVERLRSMMKEKKGTIEARLLEAKKELLEKKEEVNRLKREKGELLLGLRNELDGLISLVEE